MRLYVIRHAQTSWNLAGKAQGHIDIEPDDVGYRQIELLGKAFAGVKLDEVWSSDLVRCRATADSVSQATDAPLVIRQDLRERSFGAWEGLPFQKVHDRIAAAAEEQRISRQEVRPPDGESFADVWYRLNSVHKDLLKVNHNLAIVTHGGTGSILVAKIIQGTVESSRSFRFGNTGITEFERRDDGLFAFVRYNDVSHLQNMEVLSGSLDGVTR